MGAYTVQSLLRSVRRRLWRGRFLAAARLALWGSAGLMLVAVAIHLTARPVRIADILVAIAVLWGATMAWAALRRPSESACALWTDRHLGGASAYSTLLELRNDAKARDPQAVRWLEQWATASVPQARRLLAGQRDPMRLVGPLLSTLVTAAVATLVLTLPGLAPPARLEQAATAALSAADHANPDAVPTASIELERELASALQSAGSRNVPDRGSMDQAPRAGPGKSDGRTGSPMAMRPGAPAPGEQAAVTETLAGNAVEAEPIGPRIAAPGVGSGRDAGDSRDDRANDGVSRALPGTMSVLRRESTARNRTTERQADMGQLATFDDDLATHPAAMARAETVPPAAAPPPAAEAARLTPTEAAYVQSWMKTIAERR